LLGFSRVAPPPSLGESRAWWLQAPDGVTQVHLLFEDDRAPVAPPSGHVAVVVDGWIATTAALTAAGFAVEERTPHWGAPRAYTRTPGGHRVELMAAPPTG
jgi:catechol 2,3-dioxygenase-like lactoylglutathione lyase family enzyme